MKLLIATHNPAKLQDIKNSLFDLDIEFLSLKDINLTTKVKETGKTFAENALLKAKFYSAKTKLPVIADDGGIEIDILNGKPGVKTRRWIGNKASDDATIIKYTLYRLKKYKGKERKARLKAVICLYLPNGIYYTTTALIEGILSEQPYKKFKKGFPFDGLLYFPDKKKYYYQLKYEDKPPVNHRTYAIQKLKPILKSLIK